MNNLSIKRNLINKIRDYQNIVYLKSSDDIAKISKKEWDNDIIDESVLFEVEIISDNINGISCSCGEGSLLNLEVNTIQQKINIIEVNSIYKSVIISRWILEEGNKYNDFLILILIIENLRVLTLDYLLELKN